MDHLYIELGPDKQLNEIVITGSHDAGITGGKDNEQTQALDILQQAQAGVRFFDVRIAGHQMDDGSGVELQTFHGPSVLQSVLAPKSSGVSYSKDLGSNKNLSTTNLHVGTWGEGLSKLLRDARAFVSSGQYNSEFLILKFDKSSNWSRIADTCVRVLGDKLYNQGGNINTKTLQDLAGKVIVAFPPDGVQHVQPLYTNAGIVGWKNLYKPPTAFDPNFSGIQYWGAGGTSIFKPFKKIKQNKKNQSKILTKGVEGKEVKRSVMEKIRGVPKQTIAADPNALGMMYWTSTGILESIEERNDRMWNGHNKFGIDNMWLTAFQQCYDYLESALPPNMNALSYGSGGTLKLFMPNIVMVDFADEDKCNYIYSLNLVASTKLVQATQLIYEKMVV
jgi:hypothetical protein